MADVSADVAARRLAAQLLAGPPARDAPAVARRLLAVQAQDPRGARLAVRARTAAGTAADVDRALTRDRSLVIAWLNRGTLHLVRTEDYWWLRALTTPAQVTGNARRLGQEGVAPAQAERGVDVIVRALEREGPLTRQALGERLEAAGVPAAGQARVHLLFSASLRGLIVRGPMAGGEQAYVLVRDWLGPAPPVDPGAALAELAHRYLAGHGPATDRDLARWAGIGLGAARAGLRAAAPRLREWPGGLLDVRGRRRPPPAPPRLLGAFDPLLLGWASRAPVLGPHEPRVVSGGVFRPVALVDGRAAGTWSLSRGRVVLAPFGPLDPAAAAALDREAAAVARFLGPPPPGPGIASPGGTRAARATRATRGR